MSLRMSVSGRPWSGARRGAASGQALSGRAVGLQPGKSVGGRHRFHRLVHARVIQRDSNLVGDDVQDVEAIAVNRRSLRLATTRCRWPASL